MAQLICVWASESSAAPRLTSAKCARGELQIDTQAAKLVLTLRMNRFLPGFPLLFAATAAFAQDATNDNAEAAGAAGALLGGTCGCIAALVGLAIWIFLVVYVYRDAKARGMENAVLLTILTALTGLLGFIIYLLMRPKDKLPPGSTGPGPTV